MRLVQPQKPDAAHHSPLPYTTSHLMYSQLSSLSCTSDRIFAFSSFLQLPLHRLNRHATNTTERQHEAAAKMTAKSSIHAFGRRFGDSYRDMRARLNETIRTFRQRERDDPIKKPKQWTANSEETKVDNTFKRTNARRKTNSDSMTEETTND